MNRPPTLNRSEAALAWRKARLFIQAHSRNGEAPPRSLVVLIRRPKGPVKIQFSVIRDPWGRFIPWPGIMTTALAASELQGRGRARG